ncbi:5-formyltetrahydrofolate cyclo-ligase [Tomitella biformata]|uniref:5-formyltetrahydrofolate cyclo-ligase n=1 Tax=Tomitella biformata TaxID=630403 RepID=UPI0004655BF7|nr:5-formyltetrahydrofolate cyclo-ligase [Tomitella biformata]
MPEHIDPSSRTKAAWRRRLLDGRAAQGDPGRAADAAALTTHFVESLLPAAGTICAYVPIGTEPGSLAMLDAAVAAGVRVLLPLTGAPGPLSWAQYNSAAGLHTGRFGLREPDGPPLPPTAISAASLILIPALGADRRGVRLGRGAGHYDRSLPLASPDAAFVVVVRDAELVAHLPHDPHDVAMDYALTPDLGLVQLGAT